MADSSLQIGQADPSQHHSPSELQTLRTRFALTENAPSEAALRERVQRETKNATPKRAAVAVIFTATDGIVLIKRAQRNGDPWSGQVAFPGGKQNSNDIDLVATAIRETQEEIGVQLVRTQLVGFCDAIPATSGGIETGMTVLPVVFAVHELPHTQLQTDEVASVFDVPLTHFVPANHTQYLYMHRDLPLNLPAYALPSGDLLWGMTYRMLTTLLARREIRAT